MYISVKEAANNWGISERRVRTLCKEGRIGGAFQVGRGWSIPEDAVKPADERYRREHRFSVSLEEKKAQLDGMPSLTSGEQQRLDAEFRTEYVYHSSAIAGCVLSLRDTDLLLSGIPLPEKSREDCDKIRSLTKAYDCTVDAARNGSPLSIALIRRIHALLTENSPEDRGEFRRIPCRLPGSSARAAQPSAIESELERMLYDYEKSTEPLLLRLAKLHIVFESIHPFLDGNGRVGRLLLNHELLRAGYPAVCISFSDRRRYFTAFEEYQAGAGVTEMAALLSQCISDRLDAAISLHGKLSAAPRMLSAGMENVVLHFRYQGIPVSCEAFGNGHINKSFHVVTDTGNRYVLQCINSYAFRDVPGLMENVIAVSTYIREHGGMSLSFIPDRSGSWYYRDENGDCWRTYEHVDAVCLESPEQPDDLYEAAAAFGRFGDMLRDFPADTLHLTIPDFHNTPVRYRQLNRAIDSDTFHRVRQVLPELEFARSRESDAAALMDLLEAGELPLRVTHNDTKLNNVLFDPETRKALCVIDLDTVMPGLSAFDFGDGIRANASAAAEDEQDLSRVRLNLYYFRLFSRGYLKSCPNLTKKEKEALPLGARLITLECGIRFLTDYLEGDRYFPIRYPEHNLDRARAQFRLVQDMEDHMHELETIIQEESFRFV